MSPRKIWITRAQPAAETTAARVRALGHEPVIAPLLTVQPVEGVEVDLRGVCALAFTSANGVRAFIEATPDRSLRVFAVGAATAQAVRAAGFKNVLSADGDVEALAEGIAARKRDLKGCVLHPGAAEPAGDLVGALEGHGIEARRLILYDTVPAQLTDDELAVLAEVDAVLLHSPKAAEALALMLKTTPLPKLRALCLSKAVMKPLTRTRMAAKVFAPFPLEAALLNLIDR
ncbi:uroporphyrinogen-III synthase [Phenylobacterium sp. 20VBR1]|uniref:Uroporphyrinogen-III synthase n=1 Tax=Phenylobacterium glaciei TaxID=2803784 RepID=A0A941CYH8_9CAUL|nr:uroporphyrinogen-III synthase [Phenylobacterium glaciei]MBR7617829.1 uroporphyrinogen-III synthase [Phenylobacterium glaciei]